MVREQVPVARTPADEAAIARGSAAYTPRTLRAYDLVVHGLSNRFLWRCPTARLREQHRALVADPHLEVGVGTGFFLDDPAIDTAIRLTLFDANPHCLSHTAGRLAGRPVTTVEGDVFKPLPALADAPFASIGLSYLLHCLPGAIPQKAVVFDTLARVGRAGTVIFGATLLQGDAPRNFAARALMGAYNRKGIFTNTGDRVEDLEAALRARFKDVEVTCVGAAALFQARI
ncbi:MAG: methyltransferase type 12 [Devosia sp.]